MREYLCSTVPDLPPLPPPPPPPLPPTAAQVPTIVAAPTPKKCSSPPECVKKRWEAFYSMVFPEGSNPDNSPLYVICCNDTCSFTWTGAEHINQVCIELGIL